MRCIGAITILICAGVATADETFVTIHRVEGNRLSVTVDPSTKAGPARGSGRGRRGRMRNTAVKTVAVTVPASAKITTAMRERRTFEFRVLGELAGGLKHDVFKSMKSPLPARIVTENGRVSEINVVTPQADINQTATTAAGTSVIAIRPKRPPLKKSLEKGD